ncbi:hypothetical protein ACFFSY_23075 [Paenibacillus aurantiacus]|uniref:DUF4829 domain-containing protein n=1 Tax=Paenibacillus aurantiacus TaxID=1936118 RepID=A0ABV5KWL0_9BACL
MVYSQVEKRRTNERLESSVYPAFERIKNNQQMNQVRISDEDYFHIKEALRHQYFNKIEVASHTKISENRRAINYRIVLYKQAVNNEILYSEAHHAVVYLLKDNTGNWSIDQIDGF